VQESNPELCAISREAARPLCALRAGLLNNRYVIAMVGTRARRIRSVAAHKLSHSFASLCAVIVSGLA
jgi:hypothetical protein